MIDSLELLKIADLFQKSLKNVDQKSFNVDSSLLKTRPPVVGWDHNWGSCVQMEYKWKLFFQKTIIPEKLNFL